jgi:hypothetical protein
VEHAVEYRQEEINPTIDRKIIPLLGEGVYLVEEKYKGEDVYVVYIPKANFGYQINEPLYRFLSLCIECKYSIEQITGKIAEKFEVEQEQVELDITPWVLKFKKMAIIEYDETLPE